MITEKERDDLLEAEVEEQRALEAALKIARLEEAAAGPKITCIDWIFSVVVIVIVILVYQKHPGIWTLVVLICVQSCYLSIHRRIDALVELGKLNRPKDRAR